MNDFFANLKAEAEANPTVALAVAAGLLTAAGQFLNAAGRYRGSRAFAKDVERRVQRDARK